MSSDGQLGNAADNPVVDGQAGWKKLEYPHSDKHNGDRDRSKAEPSLPVASNEENGAGGDQDAHSPRARPGQQNPEPQHEAGSRSQE